MVRYATILLAAALAACAPSIDERLRRIDIEIAQARQEIRNMEADAIRRQAEHAATAHQFAELPDVLRPLQAAMADTDRQMAAINADLIAGYRRTIEGLDAKRSAIAGRL